MRLAQGPGLVVLLVLDLLRVGDAPLNSLRMHFTPALLALVDTEIGGSE